MKPQTDEEYFYRRISDGIYEDYFFAERFCHNCPDRYLENETGYNTCVVDYDYYSSDCTYHNKFDLIDNELRETAQKILSLLN